MNKKLILAAIAVALTASVAQAATNITGVSGQNGVYTIKPEHFSGNAGYRKYDNFTLDKNDIANLEFVRDQKSKKQPEAFVNLVNNKVNINGIVNTTRNGNFYNGHAIFITPGGFVVGSSGVLNVGKLSVATPTANTYNKLFTDEKGNKYGDVNFDYAQAIGRNVSKLTQNSDSKLPSGAADIAINGLILTRDGIEMTGKNVSVGGLMVNGVRNDGWEGERFNEEIITSEEQARRLFNALVNTDGMLPQWQGDSEYYDNLFSNNRSRVLVKSTQGMNVSGTIGNGAGAVYVTNNGSEGTKISGVVDADKIARVYNTKGDLSVANGTVRSQFGDVVILNKGANLTLDNNSKVRSNSDIEILNNGTGRLSTSASVTTGYDPNIVAGSENHIAIQNKSGSGMTVDGAVTIDDGEGEIAIHNYNGDMLINGNITNQQGNMGIINEGSGMTITKNATIENNGKLKVANTGANGMVIVGDIKNNGETRIYNDAGQLRLASDSTNTKAANITNSNGKLYIASRREATGISQTSKSVISNENGNIAIRNSGTKVAQGARGLDLQGTVTSRNGEVAINNDFGNMYVSGNTQVVRGNLGIINRDGGQNMTLASAGKIDVSDGNINIKNFGSGDMEVNSEITHGGRVNVIANRGALKLGSTVNNNSGLLGSNGGFYAAARKQGTGINVTKTFTVNGSGETLIKNISGKNGLYYAGNIDAKGNQAALVNYVGDMTVAGKMSTTNAPVIISNKGNKITVTKDANLVSGKEGKLVNTGSGIGLISVDAKIDNMKVYEQLKK